jgi:hypothetical protein
MNALELADELEKCIKNESTDLVCVDEAAAMLRQQQAEYYSLLVNHDKLYAKVVEQQAEIDKLKNLVLDNQILLDKTLNAWAKEMERRK